MPTKFASWGSSDVVSVSIAISPVSSALFSHLSKSLKFVINS